MIGLFRSKFGKRLAVFMLINMALQILAPLKSFALTSGPTSPEVSSFEPAGTTDMVDLFTGDFNYNIPLFELPGPNGSYPFNLAYHAGITMDQEASWVGLGWNINPGAINRDMRGIPDEFNGKLGDKISTYMNLKDNWTIGVTTGASYEPFGANTQKGFKMSISAGMSVFYNSYKGLGIGFETGIQGSYGKSGKVGGSLGLNLSTNSQNGASLSPRMSLSVTTKDKDNFQHGIGSTLGMSFNSLRGLGDLTLNMSTSLTKTKTILVWKLGYVGKRLTLKPELDKVPVGSFSTSGSSSLAFSATSFSPSVRMPMMGFNTDFTLNLGPKAYYQYFTFNMGGNFSIQKLQDKKKKIENDAYGYLNYEEDGEHGEMLDFNREKDGNIRKQTTHLAAPQLTYDIYNIQGQGIGGMFRPYRSDIGSVYDPSEQTTLAGGGGGLDIGFAATVKIGGNIHINVSEDKSGFGDGAGWGNSSVTFNGKTGSDDYEPYYFKTLGEKTLEPSDYMSENIGGDQVARVKLDNLTTLNGNILLNSGNNAIDFHKQRSSIQYADGSSSRRKPRLSVVEEYKNSEIENLPEFNIGYYNTLNPTEFVKIDNSTVSSYVNKVSRTSGNAKSHHIGGFSVLGINGTTHVYGLPIYNNKNVEMLYAYGQGGSLSNDADISNVGFTNYEQIPASVQKNTDAYLSRTTLPPYTTSHLLTSELGADYVDVDGNGPSDNDFGHWVKFNYAKAPIYNWRAPFNGANYAKGLYSIIEDDKGSYTYGEREAYYLATVETKTHIAVFEVSQRNDAAGVSNEYTSGIGSKSYKLDKIKIYTKHEYYTASGTVNSNAKPINTINFGYSYKLCPGIDNFDGSNTLGNGKLTLEKLWFTYDRNTKGELTPYEFKYPQGAKNPSYNRKNQDRWGTFKNYPGVSQFDHDHTYSVQDKNAADINASAWNLEEIVTPTGSRIKMNYESDDYAYVQNVRAAQMFKINSFGADPSVKNRIYSDDYNASQNYILIDPILGYNDPSQYFEDMYEDPVLKKKQIYFKVRANIKSDKGDGNNYKEYISGYAYVKSYSLVGGKIKIELEEPRFGDKIYESNPISMAAWQFLRSTMPQLCSEPGPLSGTPGTSTSSLISKIKSLATAFTSIADIFGNYYNSAHRKKWAQYADLDNSYVRLTNPTKCKFGGGHRVSKIEINDNWTFDNTSSEENSSVYGVTYKYNESDGTSFGVAQYEPITGGDEIPLRHADFHYESVPIKGGNSMYFEYPVNESYFPAAVVGYSKVCVQSLATRKVTDLELNSGVVGSGETQYEFFTAKDFPVITDYTILKNEESRVMHKHKFFIPFIGDESEEYLTLSQGFKIELNDMHGKQKSIQFYALNSKERKIDYSKPVSSVSYFYKSQPANINGKEANKLLSEVDVLNSNETRRKMEMGVEYEMFHDTRYARSYAASGGADIQAEMSLFGFAPITIPIPWPNISYSNNIVRTIATNKVIHRSGIFDKSTTSDGESTVTSENVLYDAVSGSVLLTKVLNNFDDPIYSYTSPAYWAYEKMGPAYRNIGYQKQSINSSNYSYESVTGIEQINVGSDIKYFVEGDIVGIKEHDNGVYHSSQVVGIVDNNILCSKVNGNLSTIDNDFDVIVLKSGSKNLLESNAGQIVALNTDPTNNTSKNIVCSATSVTVPANSVSYMPDYVNDIFKLWNNNLLQLGGNINMLRTTVVPMSIQNKFTSATFAGINDNIFMSFGSTNCTKSIQKKRIYIDTNLGENSTVSPPCPGTRFYADDNNNCFSLFVKILMVSGIEPDIKEEIITETKNLPCCDIVLYDFAGDPIDIESVDRFLLPVKYQTSSSTSSNGVKIGEVRYKEKTSNGTVEKTAYIFIHSNGEENCQVQIDPVIVYEYDTKNCNAASIPLVDNILGASASIFSDVWPQSFNDFTFKGTTAITSEDLRSKSLVNPYLSGEKGLWRTEKTFTYVDERIQSSQVNTKADGVFNDLPKFPWQNLTVFKTCEQQLKKWRLTNSITQYSNSSSECENKNILKIFSAALFSNNESLSSTVASNSQKEEIGTESFEEYNPGETLDRLSNSTTNLDFVKNLNNGNLEFYKLFEIIRGTGNIMETKMSLAELPAGNYDIKIKGSTVANGGIPSETFYKIISNVSIPAPNSDGIRITTGISSDFSTFISNRCWSGTLYIINKKSYTALNNLAGFDYSSQQAHSGKRSLLITANRSFPQWNLNLKLGGKYLISSWIKVPNVKTFNYSSIDAQIRFHISDGSILSSAQPINITPKGEIIEGWQKIEAVFTIPNDINYSFISMDISPYNSGDGVNRDLYIDDIRIHPYDGNIKTFVYDPVKFRLAAMLDENNYATYYYYNDEGELYLVKKESNKGIVTVQESRKSVAKR